MFCHVEVNLGIEASGKNVVDVTEESNELVTPCKNQCHICRTKLKSHVDFCDHVQIRHEEYYNVVLETMNIKDIDWILVWI